MEDAYKWSVLKIIGAVAVAAFFFIEARFYMDWSIIDYVNVIFHEAGHIIFGLFPDVMSAAGGSFMQLLIPIICVQHLHHNGYYYSSGLMAFWVGQNLIKISLYAGDAIAMKLPLLGGDNATHDWNFILTKLGLLEYTSTIANTIYFIGILTLASATVYTLLHAKDKLNPEVLRRRI